MATGCHTKCHWLLGVKALAFQDVQGILTVFLCHLPAESGALLDSRSKVGTSRTRRGSSHPDFYWVRVLVILAIEGLQSKL